MDLSNVGILHTSSGPVGVAGVVVRVEIRLILKLVDEVASRQPVIQTELVIDFHDALIQVLMNARLKPEEACSGEPIRQQTVHECQGKFR